MGPSRVYNPLDGAEVKALILAEVEKAFSEVSDFRPSVAFPVVRWNWNLVVSCYPREPQDITLQKVGAHVSSDATPEEMTSTTDIVLEGQNAVGAQGMTPADQIREEGGLPVPTLRQDRKLGFTYDEMVSQPQKEEEWRPPGVRAAIIDRGKDRLKDK